MATTKGARGRPLSPHIWQWRWAVTMIASILHRATGVGNALGVLLVTWFLLALASGPGAYATFTEFAGQPLARLVLLGFTWSICYHLLNGVRHLFWDGGKGFSVGLATVWSWVVIAGSLVLTGGIWWAAYAMRAGG